MELFQLSNENQFDDCFVELPFSFFLRPLFITPSEDAKTVQIRQNNELHNMTRLSSFPSFDILRRQMGGKAIQTFPTAVSTKATLFPQLSGRRYDPMPVVTLKTMSTSRPNAYNFGLRPDSRINPPCSVYKALKEKNHEYFTTLIFIR